jgi:hypothetical protein
MITTNWFQRKWGFEDTVLIDELYSRIVDLEQRVRVLEEENVSTTNELYRMENSLDARIDIIAERCGISYDV